MQITNQNTLSFKGKPPEMVAANKALRLMNAHYPTASSTKFRKFNSAMFNTKIQQDIGFCMGIDCTLIRKKIVLSENSDTALDYFKKFLKTLKNHKLANCFELVKLFNFIMTLNGFNVKWADILPNKINHCVALIPLKEHGFEKTDFSKTPISKMKDFLIADPWLGVIDFAPNMATLYKHHPDYNRFVGSPENYDNWDSFIPRTLLNKYYLHPYNYHSTKLTPEDIEYFTQNHPELFMNKERLIKH